MWFTGKKIKKFRFRSIRKDYFIIGLIIIFSMVACGVTSSIILYKNQLSSQQNQLHISSTKIERELNKAFDDVSHIMEYFGREIIKMEHHNIENISKLLQSVSGEDPIVKSLFSWIIFDWVDSDNNLVTHAPLSSLDKKYDISYRDYIKNTKEKPWTLFFSDPEIGIYSKELVLPAGMGIQDDQGKHLGMIAMAFNIRHLTHNLSNMLENDKVSFLIFNDKNNLILKSDDIKNTKEGDNIDKLISKIIFLNTHNNMNLEKSFKYNNTVFNYYTKIGNTPFTVLLGYNQSVLFKNIFKKFVLRVIDISIIGIVSLFVLFWIRKRMVYPILKLNEYTKEILSSNQVEDLDLRSFKARELYILAHNISKMASNANIINQNYSELLFNKEDLEQTNNEMHEYLNEARICSEFIIQDIYKPLKKLHDKSIELYDNKRFSKVELQEYVDLSNQEISKILHFIVIMQDKIKNREKFLDVNVKKVNLNNIIKDVIFMNLANLSLRKINIINDIDDKKEIIINAVYADMYRIVNDIINSFLEYNNISLIIISFDIIHNKIKLIMAGKKNDFIKLTNIDSINEIKDYNWDNIKNLVQSKYHGDIEVEMNDQIINVILSLNAITIEEKITHD